MKMNSVKSKVAAGVLSVGLLAGVGTAFAAPNAGRQLQSWYNLHFVNSTVASTWDLFDYTGQVVASFQQDNTDLQNQTVANVATAGTVEVARTSGAINDYSSLYIGDITSTTDKIKANMPGQFDTFVEGTNQVIDGIVAQLGTQAQAEINAAVKDQAKTSLAEVNQVQTDAVAELTKAITDAKAELQNLLDQEQSAATAETKANLDLQIQAQRDAIATATAALEQAKEDAIAKAGARVERQAEAALDALVRGINSDPEVVSQ